jgi:hypothetical protein
MVAVSVIMVDKVMVSIMMVYTAMVFIVVIDTVMMIAKVMFSMVVSLHGSARNGDGLQCGGGGRALNAVSKPKKLPS